MIIFIARDDVFSIIFLLDEEPFRTPESSTTQGRQVQNWEIESGQPWLKISEGQVQGLKFAIPSKGTKKHIPLISGRKLKEKSSFLKKSRARLGGDTLCETNIKSP